jgi:hypothetical protein
VGVLVELGVSDPVPVLNAPAVSHQLQQGFSCSAQAGEKQLGSLKELASRVPVATTSTIQLVPFEASAMCNVACLARSVQVMLRLLLIS